MDKVFFISLEIGQGKFIFETESHSRFLRLFFVNRNNKLPSIRQNNFK